MCGKCSDLLCLSKICFQRTPLQGLVKIASLFLVLITIGCRSLNYSNSRLHEAKAAEHRLVRFYGGRYSEYTDDQKSSDFEVLLNYARSQKDNRLAARVLYYRAMDGLLRILENSSGNTQNVDRLLLESIIIDFRMAVSLISQLNSSPGKGNAEIFYWASGACGLYSVIPHQDKEQLAAILIFNYDCYTIIDKFYQKDIREVRGNYLFHRLVSLDSSTEDLIRNRVFSESQLEKYLSLD